MAGVRIRPWNPACCEACTSAPLRSPNHGTPAHADCISQAASIAGWPKWQIHMQLSHTNTGVTQWPHFELTLDHEQSLRQAAYAYSFVLMPLSWYVTMLTVTGPHETNSPCTLSIYAAPPSKWWGQHLVG